VFAADRSLRRFNLFLMVVVTTALMLPIILALSRSVESPWGFRTYLWALSDPRLPRFYLNSSIVSAGTIILTVSCASLAGFAFSKFEFPLKSVLFLMLLITLLVPLTTAIIPLFVLIRGLDLYNSYLGLILPLAAFGVPFHTVLIANYLNSLPNELVEAAYIDGCSDFGVFWRIMLPLSMPVQAVVIVLTFLGSWNNYLLPLILLRDQALHTVPVAAVNVGSLAALFLLAVPTLIIFLLFQRVFIGSVTSGAFG